MTTLREAAQAVLTRWDSPRWEWSKHGPTADLMADLRAALAEPVQEPVAFGIEERAGVRVLYSKDGSCRPATAEEWMMWCQMRAHGIGGNGG